MQRSPFMLQQWVQAIALLILSQGVFPVLFYSLSHWSFDCPSFVLGLIYGLLALFCIEVWITVKGAAESKAALQTVLMSRRSLSLEEEIADLQEEVSDLRRELAQLRRELRDLKRTQFSDSRGSFDSRPGSRPDSHGDSRGATLRRLHRLLPVRSKTTPWWTQLQVPLHPTLALRWLGTDLRSDWAVHCQLLHSACAVGPFAERHLGGGSRLPGLTYILVKVLKTWTSAIQATASLWGCLQSEKRDVWLTLVEVQAASAADRNEPEEDLGLSENSEHLEVVQEYDCEFFFDAEQQIHLPFAQALVDLSQEDFAFFSADSLDGAPLTASEQEAGRCCMVPPQKRLQRLEEAIFHIQQSSSSQSKQQHPRGSEKPSERQSRKTVDFAREPHSYCGAPCGRQEEEEGQCVYATLSNAPLQGTGKKAAAARRAFTAAYKDQPQEISNLIERHMFEDLNSVTLSPGMGARGLKCARLSGVPLQNWQLQNKCLLRLECCWHTRQLHLWECCQGQSSCLCSSADAGPVQHRRRELDDGRGTVFILILCPASSSSHSGRRVSILKAAGSEMVFTAGGNLDTWKRLISLQVVVLDWLTLEWSAVRILEHLNVDGNTLEVVEAVDMGRAAAKFEGFEESLAAMARAITCLHASTSSYEMPCWKAHQGSYEDEALMRCGVDVGLSPYAAEPNAKPLVSDRLMFPEAPTFDPLPYFDASASELYVRPLSAGRDVASLPEPPPVQVRAAPHEKLKLLMVLDGSPANLADRERTSRNVLCGDLSLREAKEILGEYFCWSSNRVAVGLSSLAMGDTCAVEYAQYSRLSLLLQNDVATISELLTLRGAIPRGLLQVGVIVDALVILERVLRSDYMMLAWLALLAIKAAPDLRRLERPTVEQAS
eukprot:s3930_g4.t1